VEEGAKVSERKPIISVLLAIVAGIVIMVPAWFPNDPAGNFWRSIIGHSWLYSILFGLRLAVAVSLFSIATYLYSQPAKSAKWGKLAIVASLVSIASISVGGYVVGAALGVIAGATAIRWGSKEIERKGNTVA
jgi:NhaP-type Na+/H+ or K+/H+ antiporter